MNFIQIVKIICCLISVIQKMDSANYQIIVNPTGIGKGRLRILKIVFALSVYFLKSVSFCFKEVIKVLLMIQQYQIMLSMACR